MVHLFFNPLSNNKKGNNSLYDIKNIFINDKIEIYDITKIKELKKIIIGISAEDKIVISGGDGTISNFANEIYGMNIKSKIFYYPSGSGNDFYNDVKEFHDSDNKLIPMNEYLESLPCVIINDQKRVFLNGIGYGVDGYCCEEGDRIRSISDKKVDYTKIALKGFLFAFKPRNAVVCVDGIETSFSNVWLAPSMIGRFYGGGMMIAPGQSRLNSGKTVTLVVAHNISLLKVIQIFPKIYKGNHVKYNKNISFFEGHEIDVKFDKPCALQIDGETIKNVNSYKVVFR